MFLYIVKIYFETTPSYNDARISFMTNIINMRSFTQRKTSRFAMRNGKKIYMYSNRELFQAQNENFVKFSQHSEFPRDSGNRKA